MPVVSKKGVATMRHVQLAILLAWPITAQAADGRDSGGSTEASTDASTEASTEANAAMVDPATLPTPAQGGLAIDVPRSTTPRREGWIRRWAPERNTGELGAYGGGMTAGAGHELFEPSPTLPEQGHRPLAPVVAEMGGRLGYYPSRFFGLEAEGGAAPAETTNFQQVTLWTARGSMVVQLGLWSITPFVLAGGGALGVRSDRSALGNDVDPVLHVGGGLKINLSRHAQLRADVRDVLQNRRGTGALFERHDVQALVGVSVLLGRSTEGKLGRGDRDGDGIEDRQDACVDRAGDIPHGCPRMDVDYDGVPDLEDRCMLAAGDAPDGCPRPDRDGDGVPDGEDLCAVQAGMAPDGCPLPDRDGDGWVDFIDACEEEPETINGFEDGDGCPDLVPANLEELNGVMEGIHFQSGKAHVLPRSLPRLNRVAAVMRGLPEVRVEISGHTDGSGPRQLNLELSEQRANAVRDYLVAQGVAADRIETRGAGPDEPLADNKTPEGRLANRRIEFRVITAGESQE